MWPFKKKEEKPPVSVPKITPPDVIPPTGKALERPKAPAKVPPLTAKKVEEPRVMSEREAQLMAQALKVFMRGDDKE